MESNVHIIEILAMFFFLWWGQTVHANVGRGMLHESLTYSTCTCNSTIFLFTYTLYHDGGLDAQCIF